jgi:DNA-binding response OmpR family regulator
MALVVENDFWIRLVMCDVLAQAGYRVAEASNGFSALRLAQREPLSLVLLDLVLPESSPASPCWLNSGRLRRRRMFR